MALTSGENEGMKKYYKKKQIKYYKLNFLSYFCTTKDIL